MGIKTTLPLMFLGSLPHLRVVTQRVGNLPDESRVVLVWSVLTVSKAKTISAVK
jgi:hypothetical protein